MDGVSLEKRERENLRSEEGGGGDGTGRRNQTRGQGSQKDVTCVYDILKQNYQKCLKSHNVIKVTK